MAKKQVKPIVFKPVKPDEVHNDSLKEAIVTLRETRTRDNEIRMFEELQKAKLLVPVKFARDAGGVKLNFVMISAPDKKNFFPAFTDGQEASRMNAPEGDKREYVQLSLKDYEQIFRDTRGQAAGIVVNPFSANIVLERAIIGKLNTQKAAAVSGAPVNAQKGEVPAELPVRFDEPRVYPTALVNAVYEAGRTIPEISRIWYKQMLIGPNVNHGLIVEADSFSAEIAEKLKAAAEPHAKNIPVQILKLTPELDKNVIKDAVALYDRLLEI